MESQKQNSADVWSCILLHVTNATMANKLMPVSLNPMQAMGQKDLFAIIILAVSRHLSSYICM